MTGKWKRGVHNPHYEHNRECYDSYVPVLAGAFIFSATLQQWASLPHLNGKNVTHVSDTNCHTMCQAAHFRHVVQPWLTRDVEVSHAYNLLAEITRMSRKRKPSSQSDC
jgi:hypothetical protein